MTWATPADGDRAKRIGFVGEDFDPDDGSRLTGTFSAHWEAADHKDHGDGPQGVSAEEAIAWARSKATRVSVLLYDDDSLYSAGEAPYPDMPEWPEEGMLLRPARLALPATAACRRSHGALRARSRTRARSISMRWPPRSRRIHAALEEHAPGAMLLSTGIVGG